MKKILQLIETKGPGGAEMMLCHLVGHIDRSKYQVRVVMMNPGWLSEELGRLGIETVFIPSNQSWDVGFVRGLAAEIRRWRADVIHSHLPGANLYACLAGALTGKPVVTTYHGELNLPGESFRYAAIKYWLIRRFASGIVLVADYLRHDFVKVAKFPVAKLSIIYNGVPISPLSEGFSVARKRNLLGVCPEDKVVGIVANFRVPKGYDYFIEMARLVAARVPQAKFLVCGEGESDIKTRLIEKIRAYNLEDKVKLLGFRPDVPEVLQTFDVFVLSSISEGLPLSAVEAMAAHKPVVATRVGGLPELVQDGKSGYLVPPADADALADRITTLLTDDNIRVSMGNVGYDIASTTFSLQGMVDRYQDLYERLATSS